MAKVSYELERFENRLLLAQPLIAHALYKLAQQVSRGRLDSEVVGAVADLRKAANDIESANKDYSNAYLETV